MMERRVVGRHMGRRFAFMLLIPASVLISTGLAVILFWLFPVVERAGDTELIGQNPIGFWLILAGGALLLVSLVALSRRRLTRVR